MDKENQTGKTKYRMGVVGIISIGFLAIVLDLVSLIPFVGTAAGPIFGVIAGVYSYKVGVKIFSGKKLAVILTVAIVKMIPILQEIPIELIMGWVAIVIMTRTEDKLGISLSPLKKPGVKAPRLQRNPFNGKEGTRPPRITGSI